MSTATWIKERPILFSAPMVRALLAGTKTMTRRIVKPQPSYRDDVDDPTGITTNGWWWTNRRGCGIHSQPTEEAATRLLSESPYFCPYGQPGDRLWVREKWASPEANKLQPGRVAYDADGACGAYVGDGAGGLIFIHHGRILEASGYRDCFPADGDHTYGLGCYSDIRSGKYPSYRYGWRPSIHMPRWASRVTLEITGVRVERLQAISEADAQAEGVAASANFSARDHFARLWDEINGPGAWLASPWVWAISFRRVEGGGR